MGKKGYDDFTYNDAFISGDDLFRHSKWLSFMQKRILLAKDLLSNEGIIFISIDENELANLTLLCNDIFGEQNYISSNFVLDNLKGKANDNFITSVGSRLLIYAKNKNLSNLTGFNEIENVFGNKVEETYKNEDSFGYYNLITFKKTGQSKFRKDRPFMFYPILEKDGKLNSITRSEFESLYDKNLKIFHDEFLNQLRIKYNNYNFILPTDSNGDFLRWTSGFDTFVKKMNLDIVYDDGVKQKNRPKVNEMLQYYVSGTPKSFMYKPSYANGTEDFKKILPNVSFSFPKSIDLIKDIIILIKKTNLIVLDFFAGSGTTGHAVAQLNKEDGGNRRYILCTNNENNICEEVTYQRLKNIQADLPHNLKYFKTDFISRDAEYLSSELLNHINEMIELENGIKIDNQNYIVILDEEKADSLEERWNEINLPKIIYISKEVLLSTKQTELFNKVEIQIIPDYYFDFEMKEVGESW